MARPARRQSPESRAFATAIRRMRKKGFSLSEIARRTGLSKSHVHGISSGKKRISSNRAVTAQEALSNNQSAFAAIAGKGVIGVEPLDARETSKIGRYWAAMGKARKAGDYRDVKERFGKMRLRTARGNLRFETDLNALLELDDAGLLNVEEPIHYEPTTNS